MQFTICSPLVTSSSPYNLYSQVLLKSRETTCSVANKVLHLHPSTSNETANLFMTCYKQRPLEVFILFRD